MNISTKLAKTDTSKEVFVVMDLRNALAFTEALLTLAVDSGPNESSEAMMPPK